LVVDRGYDSDTLALVVQTKIQGMNSVIPFSPKKPENTKKLRSEVLAFSPHRRELTWFNESGHSS
jgi:hypothetical protein